MRMDNSGAGTCRVFELMADDLLGDMEAFISSKTQRLTLGDGDIAEGRYDMPAEENRQRERRIISQWGSRRFARALPEHQTKEAPCDWRGE